MDDDIQLPPLPPKPPVTDPDAAMQAYGRACYKAGVVIGERRAKQEAIHGHNGRTRVVFD